jgi:hypothetical protein
MLLSGIRYNSQVLHGARRTPPALPAHGASNLGAWGLIPHATADKEKQNDRCR